MSTDIALVEGASVADIMKMSGIDTDFGNSGDNGLLQLKVNRDADDDDGNPLPVGTFYVNLPDVGNVYSKTVTIRPYMQRFQYKRWNQAIEKFDCESIQIASFGEEARDTSGGIKCGKLNKKQLETASKETLEDQKAIKCSRIIYGTVEFTGTDKRGKSHDVVNIPIKWSNSGDSFMPSGEPFEVLSKRRDIPLRYKISAGLKREKNGSNTYYTPVAEIDLTQTYQITEDVSKTFSVFMDIIKKDNDRISEKYNANVSKANRTGDSTKVVDALAADLNDDIDDIGA